jgi:hypothetical protein
MPFHFPVVISCRYVIASGRLYIGPVNCIRFHDFSNLYVIICKDVLYLFTHVRFSPTSTEFGGLLLF